MRRFIIAAALVSFTAIPALAGASNSISVNAGMNVSAGKPTGSTQVSQPSKPPSRPSLPSIPPPPAR